MAGGNEPRALFLVDNPPTQSHTPTLPVTSLVLFIICGGAGGGVGGGTHVDNVVVFLLSYLPVGFGTQMPSPAFWLAPL